MIRNTVTITALLLGLLILSSNATPNEIIDPITGLSRPMTTSEKIKAKRLNIPLTVVDKDVATAVAEYVNRPWRHTDNEARVVRADKDELGYTHVRMKQYYKGVPVDGAGIIVHVTGGNVIYWITGSMAEGVNVNVKPYITATQAQQIATDHALQHKCIDPECQRWGSVDSLSSILNPASVNKSNSIIGFSGNSSLIIYNEVSLALIVKVSESGIDNAVWEYWIDADDGSVIGRRNLASYYSALPPTTNGYDTIVTGCRSHWEVNPTIGDSVVSDSGWRDTISTSRKNYFLYFKGNASQKKAPWGVFDLHNNDSIKDTINDSLCRWAQKNTNNWGTADRDIFSCGRNADLVTTWLKDTLGMYGFNNNGQFLRINAHHNQPGSAFFQGDDSIIYIGDSTIYKHTFSNLDVIAHESGHALTWFTTHLGLRSLPGGINEGYADIMSLSVKFAYQPDSSSLYPNAARGCAGWLVGADVWTDLANTIAIRDCRLPQRIENGGAIEDIYSNFSTLFEGSKYWVNYDANYGLDVHQLIGISAFSFYLLAQGNSDSIRHNEGYPYSVFQGIGISLASRVAMRAETQYIWEHSTFQDSKNGWLLAAQDLIDSGMLSGNATAVVESCWAATRVKDELRIRWVEIPMLQVGTIGTFNTCGNLMKNQSLPNGLSMRYFNTNKGVSLSNAAAKNAYISGSFTPLDSASINQNDSLNNLAGKLVVRRPSGKIAFTLDTLGNLRTWARSVESTWRQLAD